ncbi:MAG: helix-turn-helix domain-containing protein [Schleiferilactobacillus harbinensis]|jgi:transcriptional regulator with XRE-family HTH domain|nr:helix-turn-helix domain-containing protein [Schleiferilactobacillus harbinensis]MCI1913013.1 helix-turn-helix domain-containing protein [Schleiferilactobacillus harbinensis]
MYGNQFKKMRKERKMSLEYVADQIVSVSTLSRFESGKADISFAKLIQLLKRINVSLTQFSKEVETSEGVDRFGFKVTAAYQQNDTIQLSKYCLDKLKLYHDSGVPQYLYQAAEANTFLWDLNGKILIRSQDLQRLIDDISDTTFWGARELHRFGNSIPLLPDDRILRISLMLESNLSEISLRSLALLDISYTALLNALNVLCIRDPEAALTLWNNLHALSVLPSLTSIRIRRYFFSLMIDHLQGIVIDDRLNRLLGLLRETDNNELADDFTDAFQRIDKAHQDARSV